MKRCGVRLHEKGQIIGVLIVFLAIIGGACWYLFSIRQKTEKEAWDYAREVAEAIALQHDDGFIARNLSPRAQVEMPPSFRERMFTNFRELGSPEKRIGLAGKVQFTNYFFDPKGSFRAQINFPATPAYLDMTVSASRGPWQIDALNLTWFPSHERVPSSDAVH